MSGKRHRVRRTLTLAASAAFLVAGPAGAARACGGLVTPNGTINLVRTTTSPRTTRASSTTSRRSSSPARGRRSARSCRSPASDEVVKGGDWTLQRLVIETQPPVLELAADGAALAARSAEVLLETEIDSLDITVLKGGAVAVGTWARTTATSCRPMRPRCSSSTPSGPHLPGRPVQRGASRRAGGAARRRRRSTW